MKRILSIILCVAMLVSTVMVAMAELVPSVEHTHSFTEVKVIATCTRIGYTDAVCDCGYSYRISESPKENHVASTLPEDTVTVAATCNNMGYIVTYCANGCGMSAKTVFFDALGHDLVKYKSEVSCLTDGYETKKCSRCDYESEKTNFIPKRDHKNPDGTSAYGEEYIAQKPTTNTVGYWAKDCSICGDVYKFNKIPKLPIKYGDCNMDGSINICDVIVLFQYIAKWKNLYISTDNADVTHDGRINTLDVSKIMKYIAKWDVDLGSGTGVVA